MQTQARTVVYSPLHQSRFTTLMRLLLCLTLNLQWLAATGAWTERNSNYTSVAAASLVAGATGTAVAAGTAAAAASAALAAGMTTLATQAAVSLINNQGNLSATLQDLGSKENVKGLLTSMVTAGVVSGLGSAITIPNGAGGSIPLSSINATSSFGQQLTANIINNTAGAVVNSAINGTDLRTSLQNGLISALITTGAAQGANAIGDAATGRIDPATGLNIPPAIDRFAQFTAHAIVGCMAGAATNASTGGAQGSNASACGAGALGGIIGEATAMMTGGNTAGLSPSELATANARTVALSSLMGGVAVAVTGGNAAQINQAAASGANAAANNYLNHEQWKQLSAALKACAGNSACETKLAITYGDLSQKQDAALALCKENGNCAALIAEVKAGTAERDRQQQLNPTGAISSIGFSSLQLTGEKLATNPTYRDQVAKALTAEYVCKTNPAQCDKQAMIAAGVVLAGAGIAVAGTTLAGVSISGLIQAGRISLADCLAALPLCLTKAAAFAGEIATDGTAGYAGIAAAGGKVAAVGLGKVIGEFSAIKPGPLADDLAKTFSGAKYTTVTLEKDTVFYRAGTADSPLGQFFSQEVPISAVQTRIDKAVLPVWPSGGTSPLDSAFTVKIPAGTQIHIGEVGSQGGMYVGGTTQIVIPKPWTIPGVEVINSTPLK
jgi:filamentous hemagglutinin